MPTNCLWCPRRQTSGLLWNLYPGPSWCYDRTSFIVGPRVRITL